MVELLCFEMFFFRFNLTKRKHANTQTAPKLFDDLRSKVRNPYLDFLGYFDCKKENSMNFVMHSS